MSNSPANSDLIFCSECSREVGEQVFGTAPRTDVWILLEYTGPWNAKALPESDLPDAIKAHIDGWMGRLGNAKFQFIKQQESKESTDSTMFVALSREQQPLLFEFELESLTELLAIDVPAIVDHPDSYEAFLRKAPIFTVCTNGRRDIACSKYGAPVYEALKRTAGVNVWQSTHMGGHRFAATMACLPVGIVYGHLDADDAGEVIHHARDGKIVTGKLRGRSCYEAPVQAADYYLRGITGIEEFWGLRLAGVDSEGPDAWAVRFVTAVDGAQHTIHVVRRMSPWQVYESSGDASPKAMPQFHLAGHDVTGS